MKPHTNILEESLRVGRAVTVGFVNNGFWKNRISYLLQGRRIHNEVYPNEWHTSLRANPFSIMEFEEFCRSSEIQIQNRVYLSGDWRGECRFVPNVMSGYAIYDLAKKG